MRLRVALRPAAFRREPSLLRLLAFGCFALGAARARGADPNAPNASDCAADRKPCTETGPPAPIQDVVVTGTRTKESAQRALVRTEVVTRKEAERLGARSVVEALADQATVERTPPTSGVTGGIMLQGLEGERVLVLEDGQPIVGRSSGAIDLDELPIGSVERVEIVGGPMSALYGSDALGGVINIITGPPAHEGVSAQTRIEARSRNELYGGLRANYASNGSFLSLDTSLRNRPGVVFESGPDLLVPESRTTMAGLRVGTRVSERLELSLRGSFTRDDRHGILSLVEGNAEDGFRVYRNDTTLKSDRYLLRFAETLHLSRTARIEFSLGKNWYRSDALIDLRDSPSDQRTQGTDDTQRFEAVTTINEKERVWVFGLGSENSRLTDETQSFVFRNGEFVPAQRESVAPAFLTNGWAFGQLAWSFGPRLSLLLGARAEYHSQYGAIAVPRLSQAFHPAEELTLRAGVGRGFRNPTPKELGFQFDHCSLGYSVTGNPELDPERSWGVNGDASLRATPGLSVRVGGFANWIRDMIATPLDPSNQGLCRTGVNYRTENVGRAVTAGSDLGVRAEPSEWLRIKAAYSYLWTRDQDAGQPLDARPPHTLVLGLDIDLPRGFVANLSYRYKSAVFFENGETDLESVPFGTLRARIAFRPVASLQAYLGVENLTDVTRSPQDPADIRPQLGRTLYAGLSGDFSANPADTEAE